jgi:hypothetical protein
VSRALLLAATHYTPIKTCVQYTPYQQNSMFLNASTFAIVHNPQCILVSKHASLTCKLSELYHAKTIAHANVIQFYNSFLQFYSLFLQLFPKCLNEIRILGELDCDTLENRSAVAHVTLPYSIDETNVKINTTRTYFERN